MKIERIIINQAEGDTPLPSPRIYLEWEPAAAHLQEICRRKGYTLDYWKTDVFFLFSDGSWERRRFDAQMDEINSIKSVANFRAGCQRLS